MRLVGTYHKQQHYSTVQEGAKGLLYVLGDGQEFKSASAAASAVMGGKSVNGWLFSSHTEDKPSDDPRGDPVSSRRHLNGDDDVPHLQEANRGEVQNLTKRRSNTEDLKEMLRLFTGLSARRVGVQLN